MSFKEDALDYHRRGRPGKLEVITTKPLVSQRDLALAYSPGVAEPCLIIADNEEASWEYTARGNLVAVISNGTAVLGLGNLGPHGAKPVMEGKAGLFKKFADIDVFDLEIAVTEVDAFVEVVAALEPTFGGINLEDVSAPACFEIEEKLRKRLRIPVFHDDQHGTAIISGAGLLNASEIAGKRLADMKIVVSGAGAAAIACTEFFVTLGVTREHVTLVDSKGVVHRGRTDLNPQKSRFAGPDDGRHTLADAMRGADMFLGLSIGGVVTAEMLRTMNDRPIVFALANPDPEIAYEAAVAARPDALVATGRSDYPNQVNNVLGFPYIFRGALDVRATTVSEAMKTGAARALAALTREPVPDAVINAYEGKTFKFGPEYFIPKPFDPRVLWWVAPAVAKAAIESGVARVELDIEEYRERLRRKGSNAAYSIMRGMVRTAKQDPKRIVFPEAANPKLLRALQIVVDEGIARPVLLGRQEEIETICRELDLDLLGRATVIDPRDPGRVDTCAQKFWEMRRRKGITLAAARSQIMRSNYFGMMMLAMDEVDGLVSGLKLTYPDTVRPALQILGLKPGCTVATGMYMMVMKNSVKFFADATINIEPDAARLADIAIQVSDAVEGFGVAPRVAMVSFSNFGSVKHPESQRVEVALALVRAARPELQIDGPMQVDYALDAERRNDLYPFGALKGSANVLVFPTLAAANSAYKTLSVLGNAQAVGPILLGIAKPVTVLQNEASVEDIVNMTAYTVKVAQQRVK